MSDDGMGLKGKNFFIITKRTLPNGKRIVYTVIVEDVIPNLDQPWNYSLHLKDKYGKMILLERADILEMREE